MWFQPTLLQTPPGNGVLIFLRLINPDRSELAHHSEKVKKRVAPEGSATSATLFEPVAFQRKPLIMDAAFSFTAADITALR